MSWSSVFVMQMVISCITVGLDKFPHWLECVGELCLLKTVLGFTIYLIKQLGEEQYVGWEFQMQVRTLEVKSCWR